MAEKEAKVWGGSFVNIELADVRQKDQQAAVELKLGRNRLGFVGWCRTNGKTFGRGLSLACGAGRAERQFIDAGICHSFHGVDISEELAEEAKKIAVEKGYDCTYEAMDLNFCNLEKEGFDLIIAQNSLHHLVQLEHMFEQIYAALKPGGIFWMHDYCGESQFQHSDLRMDIANRLLKGLPESFLVNKMNGRSIYPVVRREPGTLVSPFESIRSGEILPIALEKFNVFVGQSVSSILHLVCPVGTRDYYISTNEGKALFETMRTLDEILIEQKVLDGVEARYIFTK